MASKVYRISRGEETLEEIGMISSIERNQNMGLVSNNAIKSIIGTNNLHQITMIDNTGSEKIIKGDGLLIENASKINIDFVKHLIKTDSKGDIETTERG